MAEARKARAVGFNHVAIEVGDIDEALSFYGRSSSSGCAAGARNQPSSISVISSSRCRKAAGSLPMMGGISVWSSMTRNQCGPRLPQLA